eukprot:PhF_6_TR7909/c0_g1_i3/m.11760
MLFWPLLFAFSFHVSNTARVNFGQSSYIGKLSTPVDVPHFLPVPPISIEVKDNVSTPCPNQYFAALAFSQDVPLASNIATTTTSNVIEFKDMQIKGCLTGSTTTLSFLLYGGEGACNVDGMVLQSGMINIKPVPVYSLVYNTWLSWQGSYITSGRIIPAMVIEILDSCGQSDTSATCVEVTVTTPPGGPTLSGTTTVGASNSYVTFADLSFPPTTTPYSLYLTFTITTKNYLGSDQWVTTPFAVNVLPSTTTTLEGVNNTLRFRPTLSLVTRANQGFECMLNTLFPQPIFIESVNAFGAVDTTDSTTIIQVMTNTTTPGSLRGVLWSKMKNGVAVFDSLFLTTCSNETDPHRLIFWNATNSPTFDGGDPQLQTLRTGAVVVKSPNFRIVATDVRASITIGTPWSGSIIVWLHDTCGAPPSPMQIVREQFNHQVVMGTPPYDRSNCTEPVRRYAFLPQQHLPALNYTVVTAEVRPAFCRKDSGFNGSIPEDKS